MDPLFFVDFLFLAFLILPLLAFFRLDAAPAVWPPLDKLEDVAFLEPDKHKPLLLLGFVRVPGNIVTVSAEIQHLVVNGGFSVTRNIVTVSAEIALGGSTVILP